MGTKRGAAASLRRTLVGATLLAGAVLAGCATGFGGGARPPQPDPEAGPVRPSESTKFGELLEELASRPGDPVEAEPVFDEPLTETDRQNRVIMAALEAQGLQTGLGERGVVVTLPDVLFEFGSSELTFGAKRKIRGIADVVLKDAGGRAVSVEGHTDSIGAELYNQALSERRAEAVAEQLRSSGVAEALLRSKGLGENFPVAPNEFEDGSDNPAGRARNRRVEIVIEN